MTASAPRPEEQQQYLSFHLAGEEYGVEILSIREVVEYQRLTPVPTTPDWVRGVMNLRGTVVPVLDLGAKLQRQPTQVEKLTCIVIFEVDLDGEATPVGVMIDRVGRVLELTADEIQEPPAFGSPVRPELLEGIGMVDEAPIAILNIQKVLTEDELAVVVAETADEGPARTGPKVTTAPRPARTPKPARTAKPKQPAEPKKSTAKDQAKQEPKPARGSGRKRSSRPKSPSPPPKKPRSADE